MKFLVIEDDEYKKNKISDCLFDNFIDANIEYAMSVSSAKCILEDITEDTIILLDMSLPTYDVDQSPSGGRPQGFGGIEILRMMEFYDLKNRVIVVTQYESISLGNRVLDVDNLKSELFLEFDFFLHDLIRFNVVSDDWKILLIEKILEIINDKHYNS
ncbi:hypothetical protein ACK32Z_09525 [Aeromonas hydrophila]|uniref:hypothetical protein n=1 Tax=Aeromonas hydrophila TaxID=644 RepID=UPI0039889E92